MRIVRKPAVKRANPTKNVNKVEKWKSNNFAEGVGVNSI